MTDELTADPESVATALRKYFNQGKRNQHNRPYHPSKKFNTEELWMRAAENCIKVKADPYSFIRACFLYNTTPGGPFANQLVGQFAINCYLNYRRVYGINEDTKQDVFEKEIKDMIKDAFNRVRLDSARRKVPMWKVLLDDTIREDMIPAFVRIVLAPNNEEIVKRWGSSAFLTFCSNPRLEVLLREMFKNNPSTFSFLQQFKNR